MTKHNRTRYLTAWRKYKASRGIDVSNYINEPTGEGSANKLTKLITTWLKYHGHQAERINTTGIWRDGRWTRSGSTLGSADISASIRPDGALYAVSVKIEVKYGRDRLSPKQIRYAEQVRAAGGVYWVVRCFDEFVDMYDGLMNGKEASI